MYNSADGGDDLVQYKTSRMDQFDFDDGDNFMADSIKEAEKEVKN